MDEPVPQMPGVPVVESPPQLPEGWHDSERDAWVDPALRSRRWWLATRVGVVVVLVAGVLGILVWVAAGHYARGVDALRQQAYSRAIGELSEAKLLVFPYRDASALEEQARRGLEREAAARSAADASLTAVTRQLDRASRRLNASDAAGVLAAVQAITPADLRAALSDAGAAADTVAVLTADLAAASEEALQEAQWTKAGRYAAALLVLEPQNQEAGVLADRARTGEQLRAKLEKAKSAAKAGRWREALRLALAVTAVRKDFPGAAAVIADARRALAPKPKPKPTPTPTPAAAPAPPAAPATGGGTSTPPQPPPP